MWVSLYLSKVRSWMYRSRFCKKMLMFGWSFSIFWDLQVLTHLCTAPIFFLFPLFLHRFKSKMSARISTNLQAFFVRTFRICFFGSCFSFMETSASIKPRKNPTSSPYDYCSRALIWGIFSVLTGKPSAIGACSPAHRKVKQPSITIIAICEGDTCWKGPLNHELFGPIYPFTFMHTFHQRWNVYIALRDRMRIMIWTCVTTTIWVECVSPCIHSSLRNLLIFRLTFSSSIFFVTHFWFETPDM